MICQFYVFATEGVGLKDRELSSTSTFTELQYASFYFPGEEEERFSAPSTFHDLCVVSTVLFGSKTNMFPKNAPEASGRSLGPSPTY